MLGEAGNLDARVINWDDWRLIDKARHSREHMQEKAGVNLRG